ncbi:MAG: 6-phosphogluconolactonase [Dokdonella sp.]|nr:6-phosphogluconolactonase [Dokdonella sp.]MCB1570349.1 6-phosphogluconolactonase [Xanthomonadales bacterium]MCB1574794.1 6-phosphogluconolactonase [Xanthomonadales bacterium]
MPWTETRHADADALAAAVAGRLSAIVDEALAARDAATLALAGGRTTPPILRHLVAAMRDASKLTILPTDERWVAADHADCNARQLREAFAGVDGVRWVTLAPDRPRGKADAGFANAMLSTVEAAFDACLLGMGADGHFASLFPGAANLRAALDPASDAAAVAIVPDPMPVAGPHPRISLSLARLLHSRHILLAVTGHEKHAVLARAMRENDLMHLPVAALLHTAGSHVEIHWSP